MQPKWIYLIMALFTGLTDRIVLTTSIIYRVEQVGLDPLQLVLVGTTLELTVFLFEIPTGVVADVYSRKLSVIIGSFLIGIGFMVEGIAPLYGLVLLSQVIWGLGWTFISGANTAWITDEVGTNQAGPLFLRGRRLYLLGNLFAIPVSIVLANYSLALPFLIGGGLRILLSIFLLVFMGESGFTPTPKEERDTWQEVLSITRQGVRHVRGSMVLLVYVAIGLLVGLYSEGWDRLNGLYLLESFEFPSFGRLDWGPVEWFGAITAGILLMGLGANWLAEKRMSRSPDQTRLLQGLYGVMVLSMVAFALADRFFIAVIFSMIFSTARSVTFPLTDAWLNTHIPSRIRATILSMTGQLDAIGQFVGGPIIGWVGTIRSTRVAILTASGILLPTVGLYGWAGKQDQLSKEENKDKIET
jgi:DHA3 family tetracycline resistance protein-like MFS transporter